MGEPRNYPQNTIKKLDLLITEPMNISTIKMRWILKSKSTYDFEEKNCNQKHRNTSCVYGMLTVGGDP